MLRHRVGIETRKYLDSIGFIDVETPYLIKYSEGARDFVVPSKVNSGPVTFTSKSTDFQATLMVSGFDRYYQIVNASVMKI